MLKCVDKLESVQGSIYLIAAYAYLVNIFFDQFEQLSVQKVLFFKSVLLNEADNSSERNKYALKFRNLRQQLPLIGYLL